MPISWGVILFLSLFPSLLRSLSLITFFYRGQLKGNGSTYSTNWGFPSRRGYLPIWIFLLTFATFIPRHILFSPSQPQASLQKLVWEPFSAYTVICYCYSGAPAKSLFFQSPWPVQLATCSVQLCFGVIAIFQPANSTRTHSTVDPLRLRQHSHSLITLCLFTKSVPGELLLPTVFNM